MIKNGLRIVVCIITAFVVSCCGSSKRENGNSLDYQTRIRIKQYVSAGRQLYNAHCSNCHQEEGEGLAALYPPVKNTGYVTEDVSRTICIIKFGMKGEILVNGKTFDQEMPANPGLSDLEIAEITTFLLNEFNDSTMLVTQPEVRSALKNCETGIN